MSGWESFAGWGAWLALAGAGTSALLVAAWLLARGGTKRRRALGAVALGAGALLVHHGAIAPLVGIVDGAHRVACCFAAGAGGVLASADGRYASRGGRIVDLASGAILGAAPPQAIVRAPRGVRFDGASAYFGDEAAPSRVAVFTGAKPVSARFVDGTEIALANPAGNCVVLAEDGPVAAVVASNRARSWLDALFPLRGAGTIDFVDLRSGRTLRSVSVARLDGFSCAREPLAGATLVGTAGGTRWVLSQERWIKVFDVPVPRPARQPKRMLAADVSPSA